MINLKVLASVAFALLLFSSLMSTCAANTNDLTADFSIIASGSCLVIDALDENSITFGLGTGSANLGGTSIVNLMSIAAAPLVVYGATDHFRLLQRTVNVNWDGHSVSLSFFSRDITGAIFAEEISIVQDISQDIIFLGVYPNLGISDASMLVYRGTYTDDGVTRTISGHAVVLTQLNGENDSVLLLLFGHDDSGIFEILWYSTEREVETPDGTITVPAADEIMASVTINAS